MPNDKKTEAKPESPRQASRFSSVRGVVRVVNQLRVLTAAR
jgi:hypothetical protein